MCQNKERKREDIWPSSNFSSLHTIFEITITDLPSQFNKVMPECPNLGFINRFKKMIDKHNIDLFYGVPIDLQTKDQTHVNMPCRKGKVLTIEVEENQKCVIITYSNWVKSLMVFWCLSLKYCLLVDIECVTVDSLLYRWLSPCWYWVCDSRLTPIPLIVSLLILSGWQWTHSYTVDCRLVDIEWMTVDSLLYRWLSPCWYWVGDSRLTPIPLIVSLLILSVWQ